MFGGKEREQGRQIAEAAFPILDEIEAEDWHWGKAEKAKLEGPGAATKTADEIARLLPVCKSFQVPLLDVLERWVELRQQAFEEQGDEIERPTSPSSGSASASTAMAICSASSPKTLPRTTLTWRPRVEPVDGESDR